MHVLSLPPAFVLSQDQTLKLNEILISAIIVACTQKPLDEVETTPLPSQGSGASLSKTYDTVSHPTSSSPEGSEEVRKDSAVHVSLSSY